MTQTSTPPPPSQPQATAPAPAPLPSLLRRTQSLLRQTQSFPPRTDLIPTMTGTFIPAHYPNTTTPITFTPCHTKTQTTFTCGHFTISQTACPYPVCLQPRHRPEIVYPATADHECNGCQRRWHAGEVQKLELEIREKQRRLAGEERRVRRGGAGRMKDVERLIVLEEEIERLKEEKAALGALVDAVVPLEV